MSEPVRHQRVCLNAGDEIVVQGLVFVLESFSNTREGPARVSFIQPAEALDVRRTDNEIYAKADQALRRNGMYRKVREDVIKILKESGIIFIDGS